MADRYCSNCGQELRDGGDFCPSCGKPSHTPALGPATSRPAIQNLPRQFGPWGARRVLLLVVVVPVLLAVAWVVFQFTLGFLDGFLRGLVGG